MSYDTKYRPAVFDDVVGNSGVVESLKKVTSKDDRPHAYLFHGPSGSGKTTLGRIIARELGCSEQDIQEINSANNRGIDTIRAITKECQFKSLSGGNRVYILDEFHQATTESQNALLKVTEDAPAHAFFIFCTTNPEKIIEPLKNRCCRYSVSLLNRDEMSFLLNRVASREGYTLTEDVLEVLIQVADGTPRTALRCFEMIEGITDIDKIIDIIYKESYDESQVIELCRTLVNQGSKWSKIVEIYKGLSGQDYEKMRIALSGYFSACLQKANTMNEVIRFSNILAELTKPLSFGTQKDELLHRISVIFLINNSK